MFFRKKKELDDLTVKAKEAVKDIVRNNCFEIEAQRQIAVKTDLFTNEEFAEFMEDALNEASIVYDDMDPDEIIAERIGNKIKTMLGADDMKVVKVES